MTPQSTFDSPPNKRSSAATIAAFRICRKQLLSFCFLLILLCCSQEVFSQTDLWWTGATNNNWTEGTNWSTTDPAVSVTTATSAPNGSVDVHFSDGSFPNAQDYTITFDNASNCRNLLIESTGTATKVNFNGGAALAVFEGIVIEVDTVGILSFGKTGSINLSATNAGHIIDFNHHVIYSSLAFDGVGGEWQFSSALTANTTVSLRNGFIDFNGLDHAIHTITLSGQGATSKVDLGVGATFTTTNLTTSGTFDSFIGDKPNFTSTDPASTSITLTFTHTATNTPVVNVGTVFGRGITLSGRTDINIGNFDLIEAQQTIAFGSNALIDADKGSIPYNGALAVFARNQHARFNFDELEIRDQSLAIEDDCDITPTTFSVSGSGGIDINWRSNAHPPPAQLLYASLLRADLMVEGVIADPAIVVIDGVNGGSVRGAAFEVSYLNDPSRDLYWIGNTADWNEPSNWSFTSGGTPLSGTLDRANGIYECPPRPQDDVFFDANSFDADGQMVTINESLAFCRDMTWQGLDQVEIDWTGTENIQIHGNLVLDKNMVEDISYNRIMTFYSSNGTIDFQSGTDNRNMSNARFAGAASSKYTQLSDEVYINTMVPFNHYIIGANNDLRLVSQMAGITTLDMTDAEIYSEGAIVTQLYLNVTTVKNNIFNEQSHWYATAPTGTISVELRGGATGAASPMKFPNFTQTSPDATLAVVARQTFDVTGDATFFGNANLGHTEIREFSPGVGGNLVLSGTNKTITMGTTSGNVSPTITAEGLVMDAPTCEEGNTLTTSANAPTTILFIDGNNIDAQWARFETVNFVGPGGDVNNPDPILDLRPEDVFNLNEGGNLNLLLRGGDNGTPDIWYWRPRPIEAGEDATSLDPDGDGFIYTGVVTDPRHWTLDATDNIGQTVTCEEPGFIPTSIDDVVFDNASGDGTEVTITSTNWEINNMTWEKDAPNAILDNMRFLMGTLRLNGSMLLAPNLDIASVSTITFQGAGVIGVDLQNLHIPLVRNSRMIFNNENGEFHFLSPFTMGGSPQLTAGELITNGHDFTAHGFIVSSNASHRLLDIQNSNILLTSTIFGRNNNVWSAAGLGDAEASLLAEGSSITFTISNGVFTGGDGAEYDEVIYEPATPVYRATFISNSTIKNLTSKGAANFVSDLTVGFLDLVTDQNHSFTAGKTTTFLPEGNIQKNGDLSRFLNLNSTSTTAFHDFVKPEGGNIYVCNINVLRVKASGKTFKTNAPVGAGGSTYAGVHTNTAANTAALADNPDNSWDFTAIPGPADFEFTEPEPHYNVGDYAEIPYLIDQNDTGPFQIHMTAPNGDAVVQDINAQGTTTMDSIGFFVTQTGDAVVDSILFFECPGFFEPGNVVAGTSALKVPSLLGKSLAADGDTEDYLMKNLQNYVYIMNGGDRSDAAGFESRLPQVAVQDGLSDSDTSNLEMITVTTTIDATELMGSTGDVFLKRHWTTTQTGDDGDAHVKFFLTQAELTSLKTAANNTDSDSLFLSKLVIYKFPSGGNPSTTTSLKQLKLSTGVATEIGATTYVYEAEVCGFAGNYYLGTIMDSDGDGIANEDDIDDDNDGVLDIEEMSCITAPDPSITLAAPAGAVNGGFVIDFYHGDFNGYHNTTIGGTVNDFNNLLAFRTGGVTYTTGVANSRILDTNGDGTEDMIDTNGDGMGDVVVTAAEYTGIRPAFEVINVTGIEPDLADGVAGGATNPTTFERDGDKGHLLAYGTNGLDLVTGLTTLGAGFVFEFNVSLNTAVLNDNIPDIIFSSIATPTGPNVVTFYDNTGSVVGNPVNVSFGAPTLVGQYDQYRVGFSQTLSRDFELAGLNMEDAGIDATNINDVAIMTIKLDQENEIGLVALNNASIAFCADLDTDHDGIPNRLDLDSDGDGCYDSFEAGVTGTTVSGMATDSISDGPYGANGFANTLESDDTQTATANYTITYSNAIDSLTADCIDSDMDGIVDGIDIDDDNDGVLDVVEDCVSPLSTFPTPTNQQTSTAPSGWSTFANNGSTDIDDGDNTSVIGGGSLFFPQLISSLFPGSAVSDFWMTGTYNPSNQGWLAPKFEANYTTFNNLIVGKEYQVVFDGAFHNLTADANVGSHGAYYLYLDFTSAGTVPQEEDKSAPIAINSQAQTITLKFTATQNSHNVLLGFYAVDASGNITNKIIRMAVWFESFKIISTESLDIDNDGIVNRLDLDSDGDGCPDSYEAGVTAIAIDSITAGPYGDNGLANSLESDDTQNASINYTLTYASVIDSISSCPQPEICDDGIDNDLDGYCDMFDDECASPTAMCIAAAAPPVFSIAEKFSVPNVWNGSYPSLADMDGDGVAEIFVYNSAKTGFYSIEGDGSNASAVSVAYDRGVVSGQTNQPAIADIDNDGTPEMMMVLSDRRVYIFNNVSGSASSYLYRSTALVTSSTGNNIDLTIADIDEDGMPEIIAGTDVFGFLPDGSFDKLVTGEQFGSSGLNPLHSIVIDIMPNNPGKEIVYSGRVYGVDLSTGTYAILADLTTISGSGYATQVPAATAVADMDLDGDLDIVFHGWIWDPNELQVLRVGVIPQFAATGMPVIANVYDDVANDGKTKNYPEAIYVTASRLTALNLNYTNSVLWVLASSDASGVTGVTAFDLNSDGKEEIIYRDTDKLRIMSGDQNPPVNLATINSASLTWEDGPAVADVDNDGAVEIIVTGNDKLVVYESAPGSPAWSFGRNIWNQRGYRYLNINDDLSIPSKEQGMAVEYPIGSGQHQLNGYNVQLNNALFAGVPIGFNALADASITVDSFNLSCPSAVMYYSITNTGDNDLFSGSSLALYDNDPTMAGASLLQVITTNAAVAKDSTVAFSANVDLTNASFPLDLYVVVNDDGSTTLPLDFSSDFPVTAVQECDYSNNMTSYLDLECDDNDMDGIPDFADLDDDNDGVLDTEENECHRTYTPTEISNFAATHGDLTYDEWAINTSSSTPGPGADAYMNYSTTTPLQGQSTFITTASFEKGALLTPISQADGNPFDFENFNVTEISNSVNITSINITDPLGSGQASGWVNYLGYLYIPDDITTDFVITLTKEVHVAHHAFYLATTDGAHYDAVNRIWDTGNDGSPDKIENLSCNFSDLELVGDVVSNHLSGGPTDERTISITIDASNAGRLVPFALNATEQGQLAALTISFSHATTMLNANAPLYDYDLDGIVNSLDLDSDGDGCYDSFEARVTGATITGTATDSIAAGPYGINGLADGVETNTDSDTINYTLRYNFAIDSTLNACDDNDMDGVPDFVDLDDDNDGILDIDELGPFVYDCTIWSSATAGSLTVDGSPINVTVSATGDLEAAQTRTMPGVCNSVIQSNQQHGDNITFDFSTPINNPILAVLSMGHADYPVSLVFTDQSGNPINIDRLANETIAGTGTSYTISGNVLTPTGYVAGEIILEQGSYSQINIAYNFIPSTATPVTDRVWFSVYSGVHEILDTDNDGIPNHLDLDSDGDGCPDSYEASVLMVTNDGMVTDSITAGPYGDNGFADALETNEDGVYTDTYNYSVAINSAQNACDDNDMDGIPDFADVDDDNDGILDSEECGNISSPMLFGTHGGTSTYLLNNGVEVIQTPIGAGPLNGYSNDNGDIATASNAGVSLSFDEPVIVHILPSIVNNPPHFGFSNGLDERYVFELDNGASFTTSDPNNKVNFSDGTGAITGTTTYTNEHALILRDPTSSNDGGWSIVSSPTSTFKLTMYNGNTIGDCKILIMPAQCVDTDNDGIPNHFDLDSDGDGCPDSFEASVLSATNTGAVTDSLSAGPYGDNGFADALETNEDGVYTDTYNYSVALNAGQNQCQDNDMDGVADFADLDDDNDGILDSLERVNLSYNVLATSPNFVDCSDSNSLNFTTNGGVTSTIGDQFTFRETNVLGATYTLSFQNPVDEVGLFFDNVLEIGKIGNFTVLYADSTVQSGLDFDVSDNTNGYTPSASAVLEKITFSGVPAITDASITGGNSTAAQAYGTIDFFGLVDKKIISITFEILDINGTGTNFTARVNPIIKCTTLDTDGDGIANHLDLDSDNDGCFDSYEAGVIGATNDGSATDSLAIVTTDTTGVGANGFANTLESNDTETAIANYTPTYAMAIDSINNCSPDSDGDGIADNIDLDDDNDGILDSEELICALVEDFENPTNPGTDSNVNGFEDAFPLGTSSISNSHNSAGYMKTGAAGSTTSFTLLEPLEDGVVGDVDGYSGLHSAFSGSGQEVIMIELAPSEVIQTGVNLQFTLDAYVVVTPTWVLDDVGYIEILGIVEGQSPTLNATNQDDRAALLAVNGVDFLGRTELVDNTAQWESFAIDAIPTNNYDRLLIIVTNDEILNTGATRPTDGTYLGFDNLKYTAERDTDGDGVYNHLDLDSDGDGCYDSYEAGVIGATNNGSATDSLAIVTTDTTGVGANGFANVLETTTLGEYDGTYTYVAAIDSLIATCHNSTPLAIDDINTTQLNEPVTGNVLTNDIDLEGDTLIVNTTPMNVMGGTVTIDSLGNYTFIPTAGQTGEGSFEYEVCDTGMPQLCDTAKVVISIIDNTSISNNPPLGVEDNLVMENGEILTASLLSNDSDPDGDSLIINTTPVSLPSVGTLVINTDGTFEYTPPTDYVGDVVFEYEVCDDGTPVACDTVEVMISVLEENGMNDVYATDDAATTMENTPVIVDVLANDNDPEDGMLTATIVDAPANGTLTQNVDGTYSYEPNDGYMGNDQFTYSVCDDGTPVACDTATVAITVLDRQEPPYVIPTPLTIPVDSIGEVCMTIQDWNTGDTFTAMTCAGSPMNGTAMPTVNGTELCLEYTPDAGFAGTDEICIIVCDQTGRCDTTSIPVTVVEPLPVGTVVEPPVVIVTPITVIEGETTEVCTVVLDPNAGDTFTTQSCGGPDNGVATPTVSGSELCIEYTPTINYSGADEICLIVCDQTGLCDTVDVPVTVVPKVLPVDSTQAPVVIVPPVVVPEDSTVTVCAPIADANPMDTHTVMTCGGPENGTVTTSINNTTDQVCVTYDPDPHFTGTDSICIIVCDNTGLCDTATIPIEVYKINDGPIAVDDIATTQLNVPVSGNVLDNDEDIDGDSLMLNTTPMNVIGGMVTISPNGDYTFTPTPGYTGTASFEYEICDPGNPVLCDTAMVSIQVIDNTSLTNNPPSGGDDNLVMEHGDVLTADLLSNDSDPDGDSLFINTTPVTAPPIGTLIINTDGTFAYAPPADYVGDVRFEYEVCDDGTPVACDTVEVMISVLEENGMNDVYATDDAATTMENTPVIVDVLANDNDPEDGMLTATIVDAPANGTLTQNVDGTYSYEPNDGYMGNDQFTYSVCDDGTPVACDTATVAITVLDRQEPPYVIPTPLTIPVDSIGEVCMTIQDWNTGDTFTAMTCAGSPMNGTATPTVNGTELCLEYTPDAGFAGTDEVCLIVCDQTGRCDTTSVPVTVVEPLPVGTVEEAPVVIVTPITVVEGETTEVCTVALDPNAGDTFTTQSCGGPDNGVATPTVSGSELCIEYTPTINYSGADEICLIVCDQTGLCDTVDVPVTVVPKVLPVDSTQAPVVIVPPVVVPEDSTVTVCAPIADANPADTHTIMTCGGPDNGTATVAIANGEVCITYDPDPHFTGTDSVCIIVCDNTGLCDTTTFPIEVLKINDGPIAVDDIATTQLNVPVSGNVLDNDEDIDGDSLMLNTTPMNVIGGMVTISPNGDYTFTPTPGYTGTASFEYEICDPGNPVLCDTAMVSIQVIDNTSLTNNPPSGGDDNLVMEHGDVLTADLLSNDSDPDGDSLFINTTPVTAPPIGTLIINTDGTFAYAPPADYVGDVRFEYEVCDDGTPVACDIVEVMISVLEENGMNDVYATNDAATTMENTPVIVDVLANDNDPEDGTLTATIVDAPANGTLTQNADGTYSYEPTDGYMGNDQFTYSVCDDGTPVACDTATVAITVLDRQEPPYVIPTPLTIPVDSIGEVCMTIQDWNTGDTFTAMTCAGSPMNGTATPTVNGTELCMEYTPDPSFAGTDEICIIVCDQTGRCDTTSVPVTVVEPLPVGTVVEPPVVIVTPITVVEGETTEVCTVILDPNAGDTFTTQSCGGPDNGIATPTVNGSELCIEYTPTANYSGDDEICLIVCDQTGLCDTVDVPVTVVPKVLPVDSTQAPVVIVPPVVVPEDSTVTVCAPIADANPADTHTVMTCGGPENGTATVAIANGEVCITYDPDPHFTGTDKVCIIVCDNTGLCDTTAFPIEVLKINDGPIAVDDIATTQLNIPVSGNVLDNDEDIDGDSLAINTTPINPIGGTAVIDSEGNYTFTPTPGFIGTASFQYEVCDPGNPVLCDTAMVSIEVVDNTSLTNNGPIGGDDNLVMENGDVLTADLLSNDSDPDGDSLFINTTPITDPPVGTLIINPDGTFAYAPPVDYVGDVRFEYEVCDDGMPMACDTVEVMISVLEDDGENSLYATDDAATTMENEPVIVDVLANDNDPEDGTLTATIVDAPTNGTLTQNADGTYRYEPNYGYMGNDQFTYSVCNDGTPVACDTATVVLTVLDRQEPPYVIPTPLTIPVDSIGEVCMTIQDWNTGDTFTAMTCAGSPMNGTATPTVNGTELCMEYTPDPSFAGTDEICIIVCDQTGRCDTTSVPVTVVEALPVGTVEEPPVVIVTPITVIEGETTEVCTVVLDPNAGDTFTTQSCGGPDNGIATPTVSANELCIEYTPSTGYTGDDEICLIVCDQTGLCDTIDVPVTVVPKVLPVDSTQAPVVIMPPVVVPEDSTVTVCAPIADANPEDTHTVMTCGGPENGTASVAIANGEVCITYEPIADFNGRDEVCIIVCDQTGLCDTLNIPIVVTPVNDPPIAEMDTLTLDEDMIINIMVQSNDSDLDMDELTTRILTGPVSGTTSLDGIGGINYTPNPNYNGVDSITYEICDDGAPQLCDTTTVSLMVNPVNDPPTLIDDINVTNVDMPVDGNVLTNDTDVDNDFLYVNTTPINVMNGNVTIDSAGNYTFTPDPGFFGEGSFQIEICDDGSPVLCDTSTVVIEVIDNTNTDNNMPTGMEDNFTMEEGTPLTSNLLANDSDPDGDVLTISTTPVTAPTSGMLTIYPDGTFEFTPNTGFVGDVAFEYEVCDNGTPQACDTVAVIVEVLVNDNENDLYATDDVVIGSQNETQSGNVTDNDNDPEGDMLAVTLIEDAENGTLILNSDGSYSFVPDPDYLGNDQFVVSICDDGTPMACDTTTTYLTVLPIHIFDLALTIRLAPTQRTKVLPGTDVFYQLTVYNQGTVDALDIHVVDYVPEDLTFNLAANTAVRTGNANDWVIGNGLSNSAISSSRSSGDSGDNLPTYTIDSLAAQDSISINIILNIKPSSKATEIKNMGEITCASNNLKGSNTSDIDSYADSDMMNDDILEDDFSSVMITLFTSDEIIIIGDTTIATLDTIVTDTIVVDPEATPVFDEEIEEEVDCSKLPAYCYHGLAIELMPIGMVEIKASDISVNDFSQCPDYQLGIWHESMPMKQPTTLAEVRSLPTNLVFTCQTLGNQDVQLYITDPEGNWNFCATYINVQDNNMACIESQATDPTNALLGGQVNTWKGEAVQEVLLNTTQADYMTTQDGFYHFELPMEEAYTVTPQKNHVPLNGVSTFDLVLMTKHILGIQPFDNPYQWIAADVNQSKTITAFDLVQLRKMILAIDTEFTNNTSWRFVDEEYTFSSDNPLTEYFPEQAHVSNLTSNMVMDFVAVKIGDINGNVRPNALHQSTSRNSDKVFEIQVTDQFLKAGQTYKIDLQAKSISKIQGYQFTLNTKNVAIEQIQNALMTTENFGLNNLEAGTITVSWNKQPNYLVNEEELFTIQLQATKDIRLSEVLQLNNQPTVAEAYDLEDNIMEVQLKFIDSDDNRAFDLAQNKPNPFRNQTSIAYTLPGNSPVELILRNEAGKVIKVLKQDGKAGYNQFELNELDLAPGFIYYQLTTKFGTKSKKMIRVE